MVFPGAQIFISPEHQHFTIEGGRSNHWMEWNSNPCCLTSQTLLISHRRTAHDENSLRSKMCDDKDY